jgi:PTH1 family peptidyl-tRNA hydrolase
MYIITGLGNPGLAYRKTRHNAGFQAIDRIAEQCGIRFNKKSFSSLCGEGTLGGERVLLVKPQTYMNLSGNAVQQVLNFYKLPPENLLVLYDDIDLPIGSMRIRANGSAGTHNGMRSIISCIHSENFPRVRIGVGKDDSLLLKDYVLKRPSRDEQKILNEVFDHAADAAELIVSGKISEAQGKYNKKHEAGKPASEEKN